MSYSLRVRARSCRTASNSRSIAVSAHCDFGRILPVESSMLPNVYASCRVVLLGELRGKHDGIEDLKLGSRNVAGLTSGLWFAAVHDEHDAGIGREGMRTAEPHGDRMMRTRIGENKAAGRLTRDVRCDAGLTRCDRVAADDDECEGQKARRRETGHVLHVSSERPMSRRVRRVPRRRRPASIPRRPRS